MLIKPIMNKIFITLLLCIVAYKAIAQTNPGTPTPGEEPYGKVNMDEPHDERL